MRFALISCEQRARKNVLSEDERLVGWLSYFVGEREIAIEGRPVTGPHGAARAESWFVGNVGSSKCLTKSVRTLLTC